MSAPATFRVTSAVLDADMLAERVLPRYPIARAATCRLFKRGLNDTYVVATGGTRYYLRVVRHGWRTRAEVHAELAMLVRLRKRGLPVSAPVPRTDGCLATRVRAPEGDRYAVLFESAEGAPVTMSGRNCRAFGSLVARIHAGLDELPFDARRFDLDSEHLIDESLESVEPFLRHRPDHWRLLQDMAALLGERAAGILPRAAPQWGACHGDYHGNNVHMDASGRMTLFDFDCYGYGFRAYDLAVFWWTQMLQLPATRAGKAAVTRRWNAFLDGYAQLRTITAAERRATELYVPIRHLWSLGLYTRGASSWGCDWLGDDYFDGQLGFMHRWITEHRLDV